MESSANEILAEYDLKKLGPPVTGKYATQKDRAWPRQVREEARLLARREVNRELRTLRAENKKLSTELAEVKKALKRVEKPVAKAK